MNSTFSCVITVMLGLISHSFAADKTQAGIAIASEGNVKVIAEDKSERELKRGSSFYTLETIVVGTESSVQLEFSDGGLVQLISASEFRVDSYTFKKLNEQNESTTSLIKGGFRALSGSIAKEDPSRVQINTPVATIGLRGTALDCNIVGGQLYLSCSQGSVEVVNSFGRVIIGEGGNQYASVGTDKTPQSFVERPKELPEKLFAFKENHSFHSVPILKPKDRSRREAAFEKPTFQGKQRPHPN